MTDSEVRPATAPHETRARRGAKRARLVASATGLLHRQGVQRTTLADVAHDADVPLGNVYYYFKTRDDLISAVIDTRAEEIRAMLDALDEEPAPAARLKALVSTWADVGEMVAADGCPIGTLVSELNKHGDALADHAGMLPRTMVDWAAGQFRALGRPEPEARELAVSLIASVLGAALVANTFRDPEMMSTQVRRIEAWIDSLT
jgi:AcrR family transcriptional regulator